jgi:hypothetical protein
VSALNDEFWDGFIILWDLVAVMETPEGVFITPQQVLATKAFDRIGGILSALISYKKLMVSPKPLRRIFLDSSVLYAAAFSATGPARRLILKGLEGSVALAISDLVLE